MSASTIEQCADAGADIFVAGSAVYGADDAAANIARLRDLVRGHPPLIPAAALVTTARVSSEPWWLSCQASDDPGGAE